MPKATSLQGITAVAFVDRLLPGVESLRAALPEHTLLLLLDPQVEGLTQIATALSGFQGLQAIHLFTHGAPGSLSLGNSRVDIDHLASDAAELQAIGAALAEEGGLLLYGCAVAQGAPGQAFIEALALATGADVAASTNATGPALLGGDWQLEAASGTIEAAAVVPDAQTWAAGLLYSFQQLAPSNAVSFPLVTSCAACQPRHSAKLRPTGSQISR